MSTITTTTTTVHEGASVKTSTTTVSGAAEPVAAKTVYFIRHGQAEHNVLWDTDIDGACNILDPKLTPKGREQAAAVQSDPVMGKGLAADKPSVCIVSPLTRTLETATIALEGCGIPFVACELFQECASLPCDTGKPVADVKPLFPMVDFSGVPPTWYEKVGHYDFQTKVYDPVGMADLKARMEAATDYLCKRPEQTIAVTAHHTVFCHLLGIEFRNCEVVKMTLAPTGPWQGRWSVAESDGEIESLTMPNGGAVTWSGSGPLRGSAKTWEAAKGKYLDGSH